MSILTHGMEVKQLWPGLASNLQICMAELRLLTINVLSVGHRYPVGIKELFIKATYILIVVTSSIAQKHFHPVHSFESMKNLSKELVLVQLNRRCDRHKLRMPHTKNCTCASTLSHHPVHYNET